MINENLERKRKMLEDHTGRFWDVEDEEYYYVGVDDGSALRKYNPITYSSGNINDPLRFTIEQINDTLKVSAFLKVDEKDRVFNDENDSLSIFLSREFPVVLSAITYTWQSALLFINKVEAYNSSRRSLLLINKNIDETFEKSRQIKLSNFPKKETKEEEISNSALEDKLFEDTL